MQGEGKEVSYDAISQGTKAAMAWLPRCRCPCGCKRLINRNSVSSVCALCDSGKHKKGYVAKT